tara:strand:+ start:9636 stop:11792 length:2157 start_codon:yes stop_codon:yes gene_type:complete
LLSLTALASDQAYQGQEKAMFWRICRLLTLNIQLIFVFDGPGRPWKRGRRGAAKIDYRKRDLLKEVLKGFGIPYHEAPGEAEAECARMQILGMVDAVWSQDSDCLMFGCTMWVRDDRVVKEKGTKDHSKENTEKDKKTVRVVRAADLKAHLHIDREGLVLLAMLVGGDYDTKGLPGCGPSAAMRILKKGLGQTLCSCRSQQDCNIWSSRLQEAFRSSGGRGVDVPMGFPDFKTLQKYNNPKVTSNDTLLNNARLNLEYVRPVNELELLEVTSSRFNIWGRRYMNWIGPVLLTRCISTRNPLLPREVLHDIKLTKRKVGKNGDEVVQRMHERKLRFSPFGVTTLRREDFEGERLGYWDGNKTNLFDPEHRVECEIPNYWLSKVLPFDALDPPPPEPKRKTAKRYEQAGASEPAGLSTGPKKKRRTCDRDADATARVKSTLEAKATAIVSVQRNRSRITRTPDRRRKVSTVPVEDIIELSDSEEELRLPPSRTRPTASERSRTAPVIDFGSPSSSDGSIDRLRDVGTGKQSFSETPSRLQQSSTIGTGDSNLPNSTLRMHIASMSSKEKHTVLPSPSNARQSYEREISLMTVPSVRDSSIYATGAGKRNSHSTTQAASTSSASLSLPSTSVSELAKSVPALATENLVSPGCGSLRAEGYSPHSVEAVRAARVRHFQPHVTSSSTTRSSLNLTTMSKVATRTTQSQFTIPPEADCVDLTED